jgi:hypothetical protein
MKRLWPVLLGGLVLALLAYGGSYWVGSAPCRSMAAGKTPELSWLQKEFNLSDNEYARISKLHAAYLAACAERCQQIDATNAELKKVLAATDNVTPDIERLLHEAARLRADCQQAMLQHFYEVSRTMPPEQGQHYLAWVFARTLGPEHTAMTQATDAAAHEHHHE